MNKINYALAASMLMAGVAHASACEGFEIKVTNNLADDLVVRRIQLQGAEIQPAGIQKINHKSTEVFTVSKATEGVALKGALIMNTLSLPSKEVRIKFDLINKGIICEHTDHSSSDKLSLSKTRLAGKVQYTINN
jgi:hypothetical protein